jgi:hypothetical protein
LILSPWTGEALRTRDITISFFLICGVCEAADAGDFQNFHFTGQRMTDYYTLGQRRTGLVTNGRGAGVTRWSTIPTSADHTDVIWANPSGATNDRIPLSVEEWNAEHICADGHSYVWLNAYRQDFPNGAHARFRIESDHAEVRVGDGPWHEITPTCGHEGQPKAFLNVPEEPYSLQVWGKIYKADGVTVGRRFFWRASMSYQNSVENPCWNGEGRVRPAVKQEEAWWDSAKGWSLGSGSMGDNEEPDGRVVQYSRWGMIGKGIGQGWVGGFRPGEVGMCLSSEPAKGPDNRTGR